MMMALGFVYHKRPNHDTQRFLTINTLQVDGLETERLRGPKT
jgi:hypothetical protein